MTNRWEFVNSLNLFYKETGIAVDSFSCVNHAKCSSQEPQRGIQVGTEAHVGTNYGEALRVVVVSLDAGGGNWSPENLERRKETIERIPSADDANLHMSGTYKFLAEIFGDSIQHGSPMSYFALLNSAKCRAADKKMDKLKDSIQWNCLPYVERELEILRPQIVWLQGAILRDYFWHKFELLDQNEASTKNAIYEVLGEENELWRGTRSTALAKIGTLTSCSHRPLVVRTVHPSHRYGAWDCFRNHEMVIVARVLRRLVGAGI